MSQVFRQLWAEARLATDERTRIYRAWLACLRLPGVTHALMVKSRDQVLTALETMDSTDAEPYLMDHFAKLIA